MGRLCSILSIPTSGGFCIVAGSHLSKRNECASFIAEWSTPRCAGVGDASECAYICKECRGCLCIEEPEMLPLALANLMWGDRVHPEFLNLSDGMRMLLCRGRPYFRKIILGKGDSTETSCALGGNALLLAQPSTGEIQKQMPPPANHFSDGLCIIFTTSVMK